METIMSFAKENFDLIVLAVSFLGVVVAVIALVYELKKKKKDKQKKEEESNE
ncbi:MAG: hypothetical protein IKW98_05155 [Prevotella sp.]|nr:hypothetical protein [Prevotella sp.]